MGREVVDFVVSLSHLVNNDGKTGTGATLGRPRRGWVDRIKNLFGHANEDTVIRQYVMNAQ